MVKNESTFKIKDRQKNLRRTLRRKKNSQNVHHNKTDFYRIKTILVHSITSSFFGRVSLTAQLFANHLAKFYRGHFPIIY